MTIGDVIDTPSGPARIVRMLGSTVLMLTEPGGVPLCHSRSAVMFMIDQTLRNDLELLSKAALTPALVTKEGRPDA